MVIYSLVFSNVAFGQSTASDMQQVVLEAYDLKNVVIFSTTEKRLNRGGDGVAVALAHIIGQSTVSDSQIERICTILDSAFRWPQLIETPVDRNADVSLLLLESRRLHTNDPAVREKISVLRSHLISLYKNGGG